MTNFYYKLVDGLYDRFKNSTVYNLTNKEINGLEIPKYLVDTITKYFVSNQNTHGKMIIINYPELMDESYYRQLHTNLRVEVFRNIEEDKIRELFINSDINERVELTDKINLIRANYFAYLENLKFYTISFELRRTIYNNAYHDILSKHGGLLESYFSNLSYLLGYVIKHTTAESSFYKEFLKSNLTSYEKVLIFYYCASFRSTIKFRNMVKQVEILDDLYEHRLYLYNFQSQDSFNNELDLILSNELF